jgi:tRNA pseudouridine13 synthase
VGTAAFRTTAEDFIVDERLVDEDSVNQSSVDQDSGQSLSGDGDHIYLQIRKRHQNTRWVAAQLGTLYGVDEKDVGYCGLKDRRALTSQWFSVRQPDRHFDDLNLASPAGLKALPECEVLQVRRHRRKLRRGTHSGNAFKITLRDYEGDVELAEQRLLTISTQGLPNYFGEQRFGIDGGNLVAADRILRQSISRHGRDDKWGLYISAARSQLFNQVLSARLEQGTWRTAVDDEVAAAGLPSGPLWGRGRNMSGKHLAKWEAQVLAPYEAWCHGLEHCGLEQERRDLVLRPEAMNWRWQERELHIEFFLPPGAYATSVLRELVFTHVPTSTAML